MTDLSGANLLQADLTDTMLGKVENHDLAS